MTTYPYSQGDLLESPNTYFFSEVNGADFLHAYVTSRLEVIVFLSTGIGPNVDALKSPGDAWLCTEWRAWLSDGAIWDVPDAVNTFLMRFAVTKRVWSAYSREVRPVEDARYDCLNLYLQVESLALETVDLTGDLRFLNLALQLGDIVSAYRRCLNPSQSAAACEILLRELSILVRIARHDQP